MPKNKSIAMVGLTLAVVLLALVGSGGAFAQPQVIGGVIQCNEYPCVATGDSQVLFERVGDGVRDRLIARGNHDTLHADTYTDDRDVARGGGGNDTLHVDDGDDNDAAKGGLGSNDVCWVDARIEAADTCEVVQYD
jgi:Ca2+-binding RTX toxin-like protein